MTSDATDAAETERAILRVKAGHADDYRAIVAIFHHRLRAALIGFCPPGVDHEEIAQLAFIEAYRNIARYTPNTNFFAWLCSIARHRLMAETQRLIRQEKNQGKYLEHAITEQLFIALEDREHLDDRRLRLLEECIALLTSSARSLISSRYDERQSICAIAERLGKSVSATSVQLFALRARLRSCVEGKLRTSAQIS